MENNDTPLVRFENDLRKIQSASRDLVGHATELATNTGLPERDIERVVKQTVEQGKWTGTQERGQPSGEYSGITR